MIIELNKKMYLVSQVFQKFILVIKSVFEFLLYITMPLAVLLIIALIFNFLRSYFAEL